MRTAVAVTDDRWAAHLRDRPDLVEANFWLPSGMGFRAVVQDEPVLFKTHWSAGNRLVGGGLYSGYARLRVSEAWSLFREGNGVATQAELLARIRHYRRDHRQDDADPDPFIGCVMLRSLFFADPGTEPPGPPDFGQPSSPGRSTTWTSPRRPTCARRSRLRSVRPGSMTTTGPRALPSPGRPREHRG